MSDELTTLVTFLSLSEANLLRGQLEEEGIPAMLSGELASSLGLGAVFNNIKLQVFSKDFLSAERVLSSMQDDSEPEPEESEVDEELKEHVATAPMPVPLKAREVDEAEPVLNERQRLADRAWMATLVGFIFPPLGMYALVLLFLVWFSDESLEGRALKVWGASLLCPLFLMSAAAWFWFFF